MWRHLALYGLITTALVLASVEASRSRRQAVFTCEAGQTMVKPPMEYEDKISCKTVIGRMADPYKLLYRKECQRWLGLTSLPHSVADSYVNECYERSNGSVVYKASVCCFGSVSSLRCFTCANASNTYECTYGGQVTTCAAGEVCLTHSNYYAHNAYSRGYRSAQCAPRSECTELSKRNSEICRSYIPSPNCTYCCGDSFCNHLYPDTYLRTYDDACKSNPCHNGGTCILNATMPRGFYCLCPANYSQPYCDRGSSLTCYNDGLRSYKATKPCYCPITKTGKHCERNTTVCSSSANYPCFNGGTCYNHTAYGSGLRCLCTAGWVGAHCETEAKLKCSADNAYIKLPRYRSGSISFNRLNCTDRKQYVERYYVGSYTSRCVYQMRRSGVPRFKNGVHGLVDRLESISLYQCDIGDGLMRYTYHMCCPSCFSNPCQNGGWCQQDSNMDYVCQCRYGYEGRNCENRINMCVISGDPHYKTIDGKQIHFQGVCKYKLLGRRQSSRDLPDLVVLGKNERRGSSDRVSYPSYFEVRYLNYTIRLKRHGVVTVDNQVVYPDQSFLPHFKITKNGQFTRFESNEGLIVDFDGEWIGLIRVPDGFRDQVEGLCGNYDGDPDNDMTTSNQTVSTSYAAVGNSWQVHDPEVPTCSGPTDDNPPDCKDETEKLLKTDEYCGLLNDSNGVFSACLKQAGQVGASFYESCKYDVCANQDNKTAAKEAACAILSTFATYCQSKKHFVLWRQKANCPVTCPTGMTFKKKTSACAATCERPDGPEKCSYPDTENCVCPDEMVLLNGTCQKPEMCTCPGGRQVGSSWLSDDCTVLYKCEACKDCPKRKVAKMYEYKHSCGSGATCKKTNGQAQCRSCRVDGGWGSWSKWSDCDRKAKLQTRSRKCNNPTPQCGGQSCSGSSTDSRKCDPSSSGPIEPDPPSCDPDFDFQKACDACNLFANPNMFVANPCSCAAYYQCSRDPLHGHYDVYERSCAPCTCWNDDTLTCDHDPLKKNPNHAQCTNQTRTPGDIQSQGVYCSFNGRRLEAIPTDAKHYIDRDAGNVVMPCAPGTVFSVKQCQCVFGQSTANNGRNPGICLDFNDEHQPFKNAQGIYVSWSRFNTATVLEKGVEGKALRFDGDRLEIPAYNNKELNKLTIGLWFKRDADAKGSQTLVSNDDCSKQGRPSIRIQSTSHGIGGGIRTAEDKLDVFNHIEVEANRWHHVTMTYDGSALKFYVDGKLTASASASGSTARVQCPLLIGSMYDTDYFHGLMDQVCLYEEALNSNEIMALYKNSVLRK